MRILIEIHPDVAALAQDLAKHLERQVRQLPAQRSFFSLALSGGHTPAALFAYWRRHPEEMRWDRIHLFWCDERCVPPDDAESNYGLARNGFIEQAGLSEAQLHRMRGEAEPNAEAVRYQAELRTLLPLDERGRPRFDAVILGMGSDGHTASLFPGSPLLAEQERICAVSVHPQSGQRRITLTLPAINAATQVHVMVAGIAKAARVAGVFAGRQGELPCPAAMVRPDRGDVIWWLDEEAASSLQHRPAG